MLAETAPSSFISTLSTFETYITEIVLVSANDLLNIDVFKTVSRGISTCRFL